MGAVALAPEGRCSGCNALVAEHEAIRPYWLEGQRLCRRSCLPWVVAKFDQEGWPPHPEDAAGDELWRRHGFLSQHETTGEETRRYLSWEAERARRFAELNCPLGTELTPELAQLLFEPFPTEPPQATVLSPDFSGNKTKAGKPKVRKRHKGRV